MPTIPISYPAQFAPGVAMSFDSGNGLATVVSDIAPMPVRVIGGQVGGGGGTAAPASRPAPLAGTSSASAVLGPFTPVAQLPVWLTLSGSWSGTVRLLRSVDGGASKQPLTIAGTAWAVFSAAACEPVWEESEPGAALYLDVQLLAGALTYRLAQ